MRARKLGYPERLRSPIVRSREALYLGPLAGLADPATEDLKNQFIEKMELLCGHYGIPLELHDADNTEAVRNLLLLTHCVLTDWVPGFQIAEPTKRGRKPTKSKLARENEFLSIFVDIELLRLESADKGISSACREFKRRSRDRRSADTLRNEYMAGRKIYARNKEVAATSFLQTALDNGWLSAPLQRARTSVQSKSVK